MNYLIVMKRMSKITMVEKQLTSFISTKTKSRRTLSRNGGDEQKGEVAIIFLVAIVVMLFTPHWKLEVATIGFIRELK